MKIVSLSILLICILVTPLSAQKVHRIKDVDFKGNKILTEDELLGQMNTQPKKSLEKLFFWKKRPDFIETSLEEDINRLKSYYNRNGFLHPEISFSLDSSRSGRLINITINIVENEFVQTGNVEFNLSGDRLTDALLDSLRTRLPVKEGKRFRDDDVFETEKLLKRSFSDHGYPFTTVKHSISLRDSNLYADLSFNVNAGERSYFGNITVSGDSLIPEKFIRKYVLFSEGGLYMQNKIDSTQQDIFGTDLFRYVVIASKKDSVLNDRIPVEILVKELPRWRLEAGAGYGTEDKLRLAAELTKLNFLGGARRLIVNGKTSYYLPFSMDVRFVQPDFAFPRLDLVLNPFFLREREISYTIDRMGGGIRFIYTFRNNFSSHFSYAFERDRILKLSDITIDSSELKHNKSVFSLGGELNLANDPFYPSKGYRMEGTASLAGLGYRAAVHFYKLEFSYVKYFTIDKDVILATKFRSGVLQTTRKLQRTPIEERFYLGGASSLRGWGRHRISPLSESGIALGGNTMLEESVELRFPIYELLHGAVFMDAGDVWYNSYQYDFGSFHYDAGLGLRLRTPIGPVRLDFATPVINDRFNLQFFISVGQPF
ncbi:MAG TPA: outer membrane protein assembly factor BamA [Bacteroidales bacterium]|nr:outer membrane protein assembly factor BamA [Bacteroidales bacterium]